MPWTVLYHENFITELDALPEAVQDELFSLVNLLVTYGPKLGRPHADTRTGSKHSNMKELRFNADDGVWRVAFAFNSARQAIILVADDKAGIVQKRFYRGIIARADSRFADHLKTLKDN